MNNLYGTISGAGTFKRQTFDHIDRGIVRPVVKAYAKAHGITYEDAHQTLKGGSSVVEGATLAPDKWELSRTCKEYRSVQRERAKAQYRKTRDRFAV